jgi:geranylgeranyl pyrophosphate synthase
VPLSDTLAAFLERARAQVDRALDRHLPVPPACPPLVSEAMRYSLFAGGKRLRPCLTLAAADAVARGSRPAAPGVIPAYTPDEAMTLALPAACAVEMIHTYSLIHDDLPAMDNDSLRRGRPTLHTVYGDGVAILAGDGLQAAAFTLLANQPDTQNVAVASRKLAILSAIGEAAGAMGMVGGQAIDLQAAGQVPAHGLTLDRDTLRAMHARKTGAMIRASAVAGAVMAGAGDDLVAAVDRYAADVGLAFQIIDDILDVEGSAAELGKTAGKDAAGAKPTYPSLYGLERSRELATQCLARADQTLADAHLIEGHLSAIAHWVINRKN